MTRIDALTKVLGSCQFTDDLQLGDFLYGYPVGSTITKGILQSIEFDPSFSWQEYQIVTSKDIPNQNIIPSYKDDEPILVVDQIHYYGQPIVLLGHRNLQKLKEAAKHIIFKYKVDDQKHQQQNLVEFNLNKGDVSAAFASSDQVKQAIYSTSAQEHLYLETQSIIAEFSQEKSHLLVTGAMQTPYDLKHCLEVVFQDRIKTFEVTPILTGGGFGGREDYTIQLAIFASLLAFKSHGIVKIVLDRQYDLKYSSKRHPSRTVVKSSISNGLLTGLDIDMELDGGAFTTTSGPILTRAMLSMGGYRCPNVRIKGVAKRTNTPPNGAFRGFGGPQAFFAVDTHINAAVSELKLDPQVFNQNNLFAPNDQLISGQTLGLDFGLTDTYKELMILAQFKSLQSTVQQYNQNHQHSKKGIGVSNVYHGIGYAGFQDINGQISVGLKKLADGQIQILTSAVEIGQGIHTVLAQIVSETLDYPLSQITVSKQSSQLVPNSGSTVASRSTQILGKLARAAALKLKTHLNENDYSVYEHYQRPGGKSFNYQTLQGHAYEDYSLASFLVVTKINLDTYLPKVEQVYVVLDSGKIINQQLAEGQVHGGVLQGLGYSLFEQMVLGDTGYLSDSLSSYEIPTSYEAPQIKIKFLESEQSRTQFLPKGLGELPLVGVGPAVSNSIRQIFPDHQFNSLPITPEKIYSELGTI